MTSQTVDATGGVSDPATALPVALGNTFSPAIAANSANGQFLVVYTDSSNDEQVDVSGQLVNTQTAQQTLRGVLSTVNAFVATNRLTPSTGSDLTYRLTMAIRALDANTPTSARVYLTSFRCPSI